MTQKKPLYNLGKAAQASQHGNVIVRFSDVTFRYIYERPIFIEVSFSMREGAKIALMGQNGAGKSTLFSLIEKKQEIEDGSISIREDATIASAPQSLPVAWSGDSIRQFFERAFSEKIYDIEPRIDKILEVVHLDLSQDRIVGTCSGGERARLLLAFALIQNPDILLLDEPTNNLDQEGLHNLTTFLQEYKKTCIVISHEADFLNSFTHGVFYLDSITHKIEQYVGNYIDVVKEISARIERERRENARLARDIANRKEQTSYFAQKGGKMRDVARKMREAVEELEEQIVELREEDKTIKEFSFPIQNLDNHEGPLARIDYLMVGRDKKITKKEYRIVMGRKAKVLLKGPNGIGKTTLINAIAAGKAKGATIGDGILVGYYRQDFSSLPLERTVYAELADARQDLTEEGLRSMASQFLLDASVLKRKIAVLSEGQKGLLVLAKLVLMRPGLLIMDEPTNHINFRHIPVLARALQKFDGALLLVSHMKEFTDLITFDAVIDLGQ